MRILSVNKWRHSKDLHTLGAPRGVMLGHEALARLGHQVDYLFIDDVSGGRELRFPHLTFSMLIVSKIRQLTARHSYDLVEISSGDGWLYGLLRGMIGRKRRPVFVATSAGLEHLVWEEAIKDSELGLQATKGFRARVIRPFVVLKEVEIAIKTSDHFIPVCTEDAEYVIERRWKPESKVTVIPRGIGSEYFVENDDLQRTRGLLFVGTWHPRKGITYIVDAFCVLKKHNPSLQLSLVGTRLSEEEVLQDFPPSIRGDIRVVPLLSPEAVIREYATHAVFVLPSTKEGLAKVLLEAMAAGMPVVASDRIGRDVIEHEVDGLLVPTRNSQALVDAVERLIMDRRFCQELGERAQAKARNYTWDRIAARYESLYEHLLEDCQRCSNPLGSSPGIALHKREYEKFYSGTDDWCQRDVQSPWYSFVRSHLPVLENRSVLEIACGRGALSCYMSELGADVYAVDIAEEALRIGSQRAKERKLDTRFMCGSFYDIPFPDNFFDVVVSCETIEHLAHPKMGLAEIRRVIKPRGRLYLTTENYLNLVGLYRLTLWLRGKSFNSGSGIQPIEQPFIYFYVLRLLKSVGFRVILTNASTHQVWIPKGGIHNLEFVERVQVLRRLLKYFGRHAYFVAEAEK